MADFSMSFDPHSLSEIARFAGFAVYMSTEVQGALVEGGQLLVGVARSNMHWKNPTGQLESSIGVMSESPYEIIIGSQLPYARRREFGFSGMVDSLGRYFPNDPGGHYMEAAAQQEAQNVLILVEQAVMRATAKIGA